MEANTLLDTMRLVGVESDEDQQLAMLDMSAVHVRNLEPWVVEMLRDRAQRAGYKSLEGYLRDHLREEAMRKRREWATRLKARQDEFRQKYGVLSDSAELIRQDREERG